MEFNEKLNEFIRSNNLGSKEENAIYDFASIFHEELKPSHCSTKLDLIEKTHSLIAKLIDSDEKVLIITHGLIKHTEDFFIRWFRVYLNVRTIIYTNKRVLVIETNKKHVPQHLFSQIPISKLLKIKSRYGNLKFFIDNKKTITFNKIQKVDRLHLHSLDLNHEKRQHPDKTGLEYVCPTCFKPQQKISVHCLNCRTQFKSSRVATWLSLLFPGFGDFYLGHRTLAILEIVGSFLFWFIYLFPQDDFSHDLYSVTFGMLVYLFFLHGVDALVTRAIARRGLYPVGKKHASNLNILRGMTIVIIGSLGYISLSTWSEAFNTTGANHYRNDQLEVALTYYDKALFLRPENEIALANKATALADIERFDEALKIFDQSLEINPDMSSTWNNRGLLFYDQAQFDEAIKNFDKALELKPNSGLYYLNRSSAYHKLNDYDQAISGFEKSIELDSSREYTWQQLIEVLGKQNKYPQIIIKLDEAEAKGIKLPFASREKGVALYKTQDYTSASAVLGQAVQQNKMDDDAWLYKGLVHEALGEMEQAESSYKSCLDITPNYFWAHVYLADLLSNIGQFSKADEQYDVAINLYADSALVWNNKGLNYHKSGKFEKAISSYKKALDLNDTYAISWENIGFSYQKLNQKKNAEQAFKTFRALTENK